MIVRKLRLQRGWSQEQLALLTGLNVRTIQRIERGQQPSLESQASLASVFEVDISTFNSGDSIMQNNSATTERVTLAADEKEALEYVKGLIGFYSHLISFIVFTSMTGFAMGIQSPVFIWMFVGWGIGILFHAINAYEMLKPISANWERKLVEKRLGRKL